MALRQSLAPAESQVTFVALQSCEWFKTLIHSRLRLLTGTVPEAKAEAQVSWDQSIPSLGYGHETCRDQANTELSFHLKYFTQKSILGYLSRWGPQRVDGRTNCSTWAIRVILKASFTTTDLLPHSWTLKLLLDAALQILFPSSWLWLLSGLLFLAPARTSVICGTALATMLVPYGPLASTGPSFWLTLNCISRCYKGTAQGILYTKLLITILYLA